MAAVWGGTTSETYSVPGAPETRQAAWRSLVLSIIALIAAAILALNVVPPTP
jgi:ABC-type Fe3+ transport system permease subunit